MRWSSVLFSLFTFLIYPAVLTTPLLYLYPVFFGCEFPPAQKLQPHCYLNSSQNVNRPRTSAALAPFRLLALGDPQLEGDSSLPDPNDPPFPSLQRLREFDLGAPAAENIRQVQISLQDFFKRDIPLLLWSYRKRLDLLGNDYYLAHVYRTLHWWLQPTHVAVLGDLLGSQWINDEEFEQRSWRFWNRVFRHGRRVEDRITRTARHEEVLGADEAWNRRIINVVGNHDIGYAGDITDERISRFEHEFGPVNWETTFTLPPKPASPSNSTTGKVTSAVSSLFGSSAPSIRLINLNSMNLDGPVYDSNIQESTYAFLNDAIARSPSLTSRKHLTIVLTHIPLHKPEGVCVDGALFNYHSGTGWLREQNHLSRSASQPILEGILGMSGNPLAPGGGLGRPGLIVTGHDHEGCEVYHYVPADVARDGEEWTAVPWESRAARTIRQADDVPGVREITLRSMMGEFGGHAGMISAWFDEELGEWRTEHATCAAGVQHIWWGVHVLDLVTVGLLIASGLAWLLECNQRPPNTSDRKRQSRSKTMPSTPAKESTLKRAGSVEVQKEEAKPSTAARHRSRARRNAE